MAFAPIRSDRLRTRLEELAAAGGTPKGGISRFPYSKEHAQAVRLVAGWMEEAGLAAGCDDFGNLVGTLSGLRSAEGWPAIVVGSHLDTVPSGGMFDGALGVIAGVEIAQALREAGRTLDHALVVVGFAVEEGCAFGVGALASRYAVGDLPRSWFDALRGYDGRTLGESIQSFTPGLPSVRIPRSIGAYLELHVEQGPVLWRTGRRAAAVSVIAGIARAAVVVEGKANHAGTTPMSDRRDALAGAAEFLLAVRSLAEAAGAPTVGTVGSLSVSPGALNVVPGEVELKAEFRSTDGAQLRRLCGEAEEELRRIGLRHGLDCRIDRWDVRDPVPLDSAVHEAIQAAIAESGCDPYPMPSGAGHDAMALASRVPAGMVFVPSVGGISHSSREQTSWEDVSLGAEVLLRASLLLDGRGPLPAGSLPEANAP